MPFQIVDKKRFAILIVIILMLVCAVLFFGIKFFKKESREKPKENLKIEELQGEVYEALIQLFDQGSNSPERADSSSLKKGDVVVIFPEKHSWSETEKTSYLILKLKITEEEADRLLQPEIIETQESIDKLTEPQKKIRRARKYRLKIENIGFDLQKFWNDPVQPNPDEIFSNSLIEEK